MRPSGEQAEHLGPELAGRIVEIGCRAAGCDRIETRVESGPSCLSFDTTLTGPAEAIGCIEPLRITFDAPLEDWEILYLGGGGCQTQTPPVAYAPHRVFGLRDSHVIGREVGLWSSNFFLPLTMARLRDGACGFLLGMEWSGDWRIEFSPRQGRSVAALRIGVDAPALADGEKLSLPRVWLVGFAGEWTHGYAATRRCVRDRISPLWPGDDRVPLITYNSWDGIGEKVGCENLPAQVAPAARLGAEVFVHDACWFGGGFPEGVGNYQTHDAQRWPEGLGPLAQEVRAHGMKFGLWFELERTVADGQAYAARPELFLGYDAGGKPGQNLLLDLSRPEARDWAYQTVTRWVQELGVEWIKWDFNFEPHAILRRVDPTGKYVFAYLDGLYALLDRIRSKMPSLHLETCASGGRRLDLGMIRRSHTVWMSDHTDNAWNCRWMQFHANMMLPGQLLARSVPMGPDTGQERFSKRSLLSRMMGRLQVDGWISRLEDRTLTEAARIVHWYKEIRHLLTADYVPLTPTPRTPRDPLAAAFVRPDGAEAVVFAFAGDQEAHVQWPLGQEGAGQLEMISAADGSPARQKLVDGKQILSLGPGEAQAMHYMRKENRT
jgi:hypothetical protein